MSDEQSDVEYHLGNPLYPMPKRTSWKCACGCDVKAQCEVCPYCGKSRKEAPPPQPTGESESTSQPLPFDPRTEISADARHIASKIVMHLWILFVLLPVIIGVLLALVGVIK